MRYDVWYMKPEWFREGILGGESKGSLTSTHVFLKTVEAENLDQVFSKMQGENWSPNGEARDLIIEKGLQHTSMSVGDVAVDEDGKVHIVQRSGFKQVDLHLDPLDRDDPPTGE